MVRLDRVFPGFNLPAPLRRLDDVSAEKLTPAVKNLLALAKNKGTANAALAEAIGQLFELSGGPTPVPPAKRSNFNDHAWSWFPNFRVTFSAAPDGLKNFLTLLAAIDDAKPALPSFTNSIARTVGQTSQSRATARCFCFSKMSLFGVLDWQETQIGTPDYWKEKAPSMIRMPSSRSGA